MSQLPPPPPPPRAGAPPPPRRPNADEIARASEGSAIVAASVSKWFGDLVAVSDVSFRIGAGVTALLGPNGAGKSTMLRMLSGQARPSQGTVSVLGGNPRDDPSVRGRIGLVPQQESVFESLDALEFVTLSARLCGLADPSRAAIDALALVDLDHTDTRRLPTYSKGMRQRVKIAQALVHEPEVVLLDEPLTGLDPRQRLEMVDVFHRLGDNGMCVVVSSHVLEEVERFGSNVLVIAKGRLAAQGDFRDIRALMNDRPMRLTVRASSPRVLASALIADDSVVGLRVDDGERLEVETSDAGEFGLAIARTARDVGSTLHEVRPLDDDLESVFRYLVGR